MKGERIKTWQRLRQRARFFQNRNPRSMPPALFFVRSMAATSALVVCCIGSFASNIGLGLGIAEGNADAPNKNVRRES
jgi:hypothetical protein